VSAKESIKEKKEKCLILTRLKHNRSHNGFTRKKKGSTNNFIWYIGIIVSNFNDEKC
jgi:hypothetical protein